MATPLVRYRVNASTFADIQGTLGQVEAETRYLKKAGGGMTGALTVLAPAAGTNIATKEYVDARGAPVGTLMPWAGALQTAPAGWLPCGWGNQADRNAYPALYAVIGTTYGGDGNPNFTLPVIQARTPVGYDGGTFSSLGQMTGGPTASTPWNTVPNMTAQFVMHNQAGPTVLSSGNGIFSGFQGSGTLYHSHQNPVAGAGSYGYWGWSNNGGAADHENRQPYIVLQYIIKY